MQEQKIYELMTGTTNDNYPDQISTVNSSEDVWYSDSGTRIQYRYRFKCQTCHFLKWGVSPQGLDGKKVQIHDKDQGNEPK